MAKLIKNTVLVLVCLLLIVPAVLMATGVARFQVFIVHTGSMNPAIPPSSAVIVEKGVYRVGQVITFATANGVVTHRLVEQRSDGTLVTKGDANATVDPGTLAPANVIGGVVAAPPLLGYAFLFLKTPAGVAFLLAALACLWLAKSLVFKGATQQQQA